MRSRGSTGRVLLATHKETGDKYAIKVLFKPQAEKFLAQSAKPDALLAELQILHKIDHPHIVSLKEFYETKKRLYMGMQHYMQMHTLIIILVVLEYAKHGDLFDDIVTKDRYTEAHAREVFRQLTLGAMLCF